MRGDWTQNMDWTQRMTEVALIERQYLDEHGSLPTLAYVGRQLGLSLERIRQIRWKVERWNRQHPDEQPDAHVRLWKQWYIRNMRKVLPLLIRVANGKPILKAPLRAKYTVYKPGKRKPTPLWPRYSGRQPTMLTHYNFTQEALREMAKIVHWDDVVYRAGTDYIVYIRH